MSSGTRLYVSRLPTKARHLKKLMHIFAILALQLMFCAGWVHRDISSGNIMAHRDSDAWQAKLGDLEYAKKYPPYDAGDEASIDPKTVWFYLVINVSLPLTVHFQGNSLLYGR